MGKPTESKMRIYMFETPNWSSRMKSLRTIKQITLEGQTRRSVIIEELQLKNMVRRERSRRR